MTGSSSFLPARNQAAETRERSPANTLQGSTLVQSEVIGLVAFDLVLRIILARMMDITFVVHVARMHSHDPAADSASLGIPTYVIADFECLFHDFIVVPPWVRCGPYSSRRCLPCSWRKEWQARQDGRTVRALR